MIINGRCTICGKHPEYCTCQPSDASAGYPQREQIMEDRERGLYGKFKVERRDGSSGPGGKHEHCTFFVLDLRMIGLQPRLWKHTRMPARVNFPYWRLTSGA